MKTEFPLDKFKALPTPFYYYDTALLRRTLDTINEEAGRYGNFTVHYAVKANSNPKILSIISGKGLGADCVSGGEILAALRAGIPAGKIVFAGVGKTDSEIETGLAAGIFCFNVESVPELEVISALAKKKGVQAHVCLRINPEVGAHTLKEITTGKAENKFGIAIRDMMPVVRLIGKLPNLTFEGLHFHIGSQILEYGDFIALCGRIEELQQTLDREGIEVRNINVGGGLGIDYNNPDRQPVPDFKGYFETYHKHLKLRPGQQVHFELGRSVTGQCGTLVARTLYVKHGVEKTFAILDAGFTELIRPAFYHATHRMENLTPGTGGGQMYDVVGPICESSDVFATGYPLQEVRRGDLIAFRSAGAYGEAMASQYNCRSLPASYTAEELN